MIQDILPHQLDNQYHPVPPTPESTLLCYRERQVCVKTGPDGAISFPTFREAEAVSDKETLYTDYRYLFSLDGRGYYLGSRLDFEQIPGYHMERIQVFRQMNPKPLAFAGVSGFQLHNWYEQRKYCGRCGFRMRHDEKERMMRCPACGSMEYPKICPAVIIAVTDHDRILLSRYAGREFKNYALLAGFNEIGESIEETVHREVMEEVGLKVTNLRYYKSQPWGFTDTLLMGFFCDLDGDGMIRLDENELSYAEWFERGRMPVTPDGVSLTNEMMHVFMRGDS